MLRIGQSGLRSSRRARPRGGGPVFFITAWNRSGRHAARGGFAQCRSSRISPCCLGKTYLQYRETGLDLSDRPLEQAQRCADAALATDSLDSESSTAYELLGWLNYARGEVQQAVNYMKAASAHQGSNPDTLALLCNCYLISGQMRLAKLLIPQAQAMDPLSSVYQTLPALGGRT